MRHTSSDQIATKSFIRIDRVEVVRAHSATQLVFDHHLKQKLEISTGRFKDKSVHVRLNGNCVFEDGLPYVDNANVYPHSHIALQNHFKGKRVQFRNVQIRKT
jgi:hypothetical protein